jgi:hypothetical protein
MKPVTLEDLNLTPEEMAVLVAGSQRHLPARDVDGSLLDVTPDVDEKQED